MHQYKQSNVHPLVKLHHIENETSEHQMKSSKTQITLDCFTTEFPYFLQTRPGWKPTFLLAQENLPNKSRTCVFRTTLNPLNPEKTDDWRPNGWWLQVPHELGLPWKSNSKEASSQPADREKRARRWVIAKRRRFTIWRTCSLRFFRFESLPLGFLCLGNVRAREHTSRWWCGPLDSHMVSWLTVSSSSCESPSPHRRQSLLCGSGERRILHVSHIYIHN